MWIFEGVISYSMGQFNRCFEKFPKAWFHISRIKIVSDFFIKKEFYVTY